MTTEKEPRTLIDLAVAFEDHMRDNHDVFWNADWADWDADAERLRALEGKVATLEQHIRTLTGQLETIRRYYNLHQRFQHGGNPENEI